MKRIMIISGCIMLSVCLIMCKKSTPKNNATCTTCSNTPITHRTDTSGTFYFLPTAFTPNGDGINDVFYLFFSGLDTNNSSMTIWNLSGTEVFAGKITKGWDGSDMGGGKCGAGEYPVYLQLKTSAGVTVNMCACANLLAYSGSCIQTHGVTYYFPDQLDTAGFVNTTNDVLCP